MKAMNSLATLALTAYAVIALSACSKTSNDSTPAAATPAASCTLSYDGTYRDASGNPCNGNSSTSCPAQGYYNGPNGQYTPCTPGQMISNPYYPPSSNYPYSANPTSGCDQWTQQYQQLYVPIYLNGQLVCANYADLQSSIQQTSQYAYYQSTPYYNDPSYYYAYPPYSGGGNGGNGSQICLGGSTGGFSGAGCFSF